MADERGKQVVPAATDVTFTRRAFGRGVVGLASAGYACAVGYPVLRYLASGASIADEGAQVSEVALGKPDSLAAGSGKNFAFGNKPAVIVRDAGGELHAYIATCSHLGCTVAYDPSLKLFKCPCHGGTYDPASGKNVGGPPPKPLEPLVASVEKDLIVVRRPGAAPAAPAAPATPATPTTPVPVPEGGAK